MTRRLLLLAGLALALLQPSPAWAAVSIVQSLVNQAPGSDTTHTFTLPGNLTSTNAIVVGVTVRSSGNVTGCSDATNGAYTLDMEDPGWVYIFSKRNITGGVNQITCTTNIVSNIAFAAYELSGASNSASPQAPTPQTNTSATTHVCAPSMNGVTGTGFVLVIGGEGAGSVTVTAGSGYTLDSTNTENYIQQRRIATVTDNNGQFTTSGAITTHCGMVLYFEAAAGGSTHRARLLMGVG
jgi:hypothetical protein